MLAQKLLLPLWLAAPLVLVFNGAGCISSANVRARPAEGRVHASAKVAVKAPNAKVRAKVGVDPRKIGDLATWIAAGIRDAHDERAENGGAEVYTTDFGARGDYRARGVGGGGDVDGDLEPTSWSVSANRGGASGHGHRNGRDVSFADAEPPSWGGGADESVDVEVGPGQSLGDLIGGGVIVGGERLRLDEIRPLAPAYELDADVGWDDMGALRVHEGGVRATVELSRGNLPADGGETDVVIQIRGDGDAEAPASSRRWVHLVIDHSDSMALSWDQVLEATRGLIRGLNARDMIQIVGYGSRAIELMPTTEVGDGSLAARLVGELEVGGFSNIEAGLEMAYDAVGRASRGSGDSVLVILISDGAPNAGAFGPDQLGRISSRAQADLGCTTAVVGLGDEFETTVLRAIAEEGRGGYHVAPGAMDLLPALLAEVGVRAVPVARDVEIAVQVPSGVEILEVRDGNSGIRQEGQQVLFALPALHASEERRVVVRLGVAATSEATSAEIASVRLSFGSGGQELSMEQDLSVSFGSSSHRSSTAAALAVLDADLGVAVDRSRDALRRRDHQAAAEALLEHNRRAADADLASLAGAQLRQRSTMVERLASVLASLGPNASDQDRGMVVRAMGSLAIRLGR